MFTKSLIALALSGVALSAQAGVVLQQNFNNVAGLSGAGYTLANNSTPAGPIANWYQGDQSIFPAAEGPAESYIAANFNLADAGGTLDAWIITPEYDTGNTVKITFMARADAADGFFDQMSFGWSNGSAVMTDFVMSSEVTVPTAGWQQYTVWVDSTKAGTSGRFAIRYTGAGDTSNYIGIDSLTVTVPEPSSMIALATGLLGLTLVRRKRG
jgi:hypothetical protein